jgi:hypothetical protein
MRRCRAYASAMQNSSACPRCGSALTYGMDVVTYEVFWTVRVMVGSFGEGPPSSEAETRRPPQRAAGRVQRWVR